MSNKNGVDTFLIRTLIASRSAEVPEQLLIELLDQLEAQNTLLLKLVAKHGEGILEQASTVPCYRECKGIPFPYNYIW